MRFEPKEETQSGRRARILLMAYFYPPQVTAGSLRPSRLARYLPEFGYDVDVVSLRAHTAGGVDGVHYVSPEDGGAAGRLFSKGVWIAEVLTDRTTYHLEWTAGAVRTASALAKERRFDAIVSTGPPQASHAAAALLKRRLRIPWIADFRDPMVVPGTAPPPDLLWMERRFFAAADAILAVTDHVAGHWRERLPEYAHKYDVIWNGFDPAEEFGPAELPARDYRVISHLGDIYGPRHPSRFLASLGRLREKMPALRDLRIHLVGPMDEGAPCRSMPEFRQFAAEGALEYNAAVVPREEALRRTAASDYLLLLDISQKGIGYTVPAKLFDYIRGGRPILAYTPPNSPVGDILRQSDTRHCCVHPGDTEEQEDAKVGGFLAEPSTITIANDWFWTRFDGRRQAEAFAGRLDKLVRTTGEPDRAPAAVH